MNTFKKKCIAVSNAVCFLYEVYDTGWLYGDTVPTISVIQCVLLEKMNIHIMYG
jgi:hypothetical protein